MAREIFKNLPNTTTPLTAPRLNGLLDGDEPMGNIVVDSIKGKNEFNIINLTFPNDSNVTINYSAGTITLKDYYHQTGQTLHELCPNMVAGETYFLSWTEPDVVNPYIHLAGSSTGWTMNTSHTITQAELNGVIALYGGASGTTTEYTISNFQIEKGTSKTDYAPFQNLTGQEIYSINEIQIGTWINGKPIYRKCYQLNKTASELIIEQINNLDVIVNCNTYLKRNDNYKNINNFYSNSNDYGSTYVDTGNIIKYAGSYTGTLYIVIEYTKTTD